MAIVYFEYPGIFVEYPNDDQASIATFAKESLDRLSTVTLGKKLIGEFAPADSKPNWGQTYKMCTLGISPPSIQNLGFPAKPKVRTGLAETKDAPGDFNNVQGRKPQKIVTWWPKSENTSLRQGIQVMPAMAPAEWQQGNISLEANPNKKTGKPNPEKFKYYGENQTFFIAFVHELIHAYNALNGTSRQDSGEEEQLTVGIHGFINATYTENKFRALFNMRLRADYKSISGIKADVNIVQNMTPFCRESGVEARAPK
jgi:hypothetical protein